jgi:hypothetical protein
MDFDNVDSTEPVQKWVHWQALVLMVLNFQFLILENIYAQLHSLWFILYNKHQFRICVISYLGLT